MPSYEHGHYLRYVNGGCRCTDCRAAAAAHRLRQRRRKAHMAWRGETHYVPPVGVARRLQALAVMGYSDTNLARMLGTDHGTMRRRRRGEYYAKHRPGTVQRIVNLYEQLWDKPAPPSVGATRAKKIAAREGYAPPMAWDDDTIDDPSAEPFWNPADGIECPSCGAKPLEACFYIERQRGTKRLLGGSHAARARRIAA